MRTIRLIVKPLKPRLGYAVKVTELAAFKTARRAMGLRKNRSDSLDIGIYFGEYTAIIESREQHRPVNDARLACSLNTRGFEHQSRDTTLSRFSVIGLRERPKRRH